MNVVYIHYHFRSGGVTSVLQRHIKSLNGVVNPFLLIGEEPELHTNIPYCVIPSLAYDRDRKDNFSPEKIGEEILKATKEFFGKDADLYHIHNPILGKNRDYIDIINYLIGKDQKLLLQIHDFAEDGRADNYQQIPYPSDVHYVVLNRRDYNILRKAGLNSRGLHLIPNPIEMINDAEMQYSSKQNNLILYPVRAIRRKNIGEAVLLSLFIKNGNYIGITLEPTSKIDTVHYNQWKKFSKYNGLRIAYGIGIDRNFLDLIHFSKVMITTSIKEGFGMSYLEPWIFKRMLLGRRLDDICDDFSSKGVNLDFLYEKLRVPINRLKIEIIKDKIVNCYLNNLKSFGLIKNVDEIKDKVESLFSDGLIDFGILDEENQSEIIQNALKDTGIKKEIEKINDKLEIFSSLDDFDFSKTIKKNELIVKREYSLERIGELLIKTYNSVLKDVVKQSINKKILIEEFNTLERISLLLCN